MAGFTIGRVAKAAGVGVETVRYYERQGLIEKPMPRRISHREYSTSVVDRIRFIKRSQELGFTLSEVSELLALADESGASRKRVKELATKKLIAIREKLADLQQMESTLSALVNDCSGKGPLAGCPIIDAITNNHSQCEY